MSNKNNITMVLREVDIYSKILAVILCLLFVGYFFLNTIIISRIEKEIINDYKDIYSIIRRFSYYYDNVELLSLKEGHYYNNDVDLVVNIDTNVKVFFVGINKLRTALEQLIGNNLWTIAVFQNSSKYVYFSPLRKNYEKLYKEVNNNLIENIVDRRSLKKTYQFFYGCNLKITESYKEDETNQIIRSIYYPIYNKKHLDSLLIVDIKKTLLYDKVIDFNKKYYTIINLDINDIYTKTINIPCSDKGKITLGISIVDLIKGIIIPSLLFSVGLFFLRKRFNHRKYLVQCDRMTGFYRRDYYEKRLNRMKSHSFIIIDIDHFKRINDTYGHKEGDYVIQEVTDRILSLLQDKDAAIRWGGEEFLITFKSFTYEQLEAKAEQIRIEVESKSVNKQLVTISIGGIAKSGISFFEAYKLADSALYLSKESGRNRVTIVE